MESSSEYCLMILLSYVELDRSSEYIVEKQDRDMGLKGKTCK